MLICPSLPSRGLLHPKFPVPTSRRAYRSAGRWRQVGLWRGSRGEARQMRYLFFRSVFTLHIGRTLILLVRNLIGINGESSFERALLQRAPGCEAWGYDYSVAGVRAPYSIPFLLSGTPTDSPLTSGDPRSTMTPSSSAEHTSNPGRLMGPTAMGRTTIPSGGHSTRS